MNINVGSTDRIIRILLGIVLIALPFVLGWVGGAKIISIVIGAVMLFTGFSRLCLLYSLLGIDTRGKNPS